MCSREWRSRIATLMLWTKVEHCIKVYRLAHPSLESALKCPCVSLANQDGLASKSYPIIHRVSNFVHRKLIYAHWLFGFPKVCFRLVQTSDFRESWILSLSHQNRINMTSHKTAGHLPRLFSKRDSHLIYIAAHATHKRILFSPHQWKSEKTLCFPAPGEKYCMWAGSVCRICH